MFGCISEDIYSVSGIFYHRFVDTFCTVSRKYFIVDCFFGPAVGDTSTVERKDVTSIIFQMKLLCQWNDTFCRASAGENNFFTGFLNLDQSIQGRLCNFFLGVGKSSVQIARRQRQMCIRDRISRLFRFFLLFYNSSKA